MTPMQARLKELHIAVILLTRLPAGQVRGDVPSLTEARWAFPFVGLLIGWIVWAAYGVLFWLGAAPMLAALGALTALVLLTGALHVDGLADYTDGIGGGRDTAHRLEIMRDSSIGSYGVAALIICLGVWVTSIGAIGAQAGLLAFLMIGFSSRYMMVLLLEVLPPARGDGMGVLAEGRAPMALLLGGVAAVFLALFLGVAGLVTLAVMLLVTALLGWQAKRYIGGHTGDVLGATQLISETLAWALLSVFL
ncbi:adenosylcobinamide-GDP ribazoletransferase [Lentibacter algarum]|uniref:adenosylcobinamide-GDP ribazoletransferase n=1 Tax=Lentibacter algarum TaxID=576131 RepID=UPI001C079E3B|nr:adenosylcobinamide-GDP ribazoletransferase [Lentibacter algarum]MBU2981669.1 adenosylcobinamide-GDP ribazoletransferase [Lentibacter algarum]